MTRTRIAGLSLIFAVVIALALRGGCGDAEEVGEPPIGKSDTQREPIPGTTKRPAGRVEPSSKSTSAFAPGESARPDLSEGWLDIKLRDLADGLPAVGVPFLINIQATSTNPEVREVLVSDADGRVRIPAKDAASITGRRGAWTIVREPTEVGDGTVERWCYRTVQILGEIIDPADGTDFERVNLGFACVAGSAPFRELGEMPVEPWTATWFRVHKIQSSGQLKTSIRDGRFDVEVPRIRGLRITASTPHGSNGVVRVPVSSVTEVVRVTLRLQPGTRVVGRLLDESGNAVAGATIKIYCEWRTPAGELDLASVEARGEGVCAGSILGSTDVQVWVRRTAVSDSNGQFELTSKSSGTAVLYSWIEGRPPVRIPLGKVEGKVDVGDVRVESRKSGQRVSFKSGGVALAKHGVMAVDLWSEAGQAVLPDIVLDGDGSMDAAWFELGRRYYLHVSGPRIGADEGMGCVVWDGRPSIDIASELEEVP